MRCQCAICVSGGARRRLMLVFSIDPSRIQRVGNHRVVSVTVDGVEVWQYGNGKERWVADPERFAR